jgi:hypothetical protein
MDFIDHRSTANFIFSLSATDEKFRITNNDEKFRITNNGDVGIGTSSPSTKLEVNGVITTAGLTTTANINFGDNDKAIFGADSDLQIYHDGSHSFVSDQGTGNLRLLAENFQVKNAADNEAMIVAVPDAGVSLYYNNLAKLATTSTGIDVTGTAVTDGLTVDGSSTFNSGANTATFSLADSGYIKITHPTRGGDYRLETNGTNADHFDIESGTEKLARFSANGDISFYEDTGTTAKLFWDASAERLGIGTTSPSFGIDVVAPSNEQLRVDGTSATDTTILMDYNGGGATNRVRLLNKAGDFAINVDNTSEAIRIDTSGNLLVGTTSTNPAGGTGVGIQLNPIGQVNTSRSGGASGVFNRTTSDGEIIQLKKDGTTVGSIGTSSSSLYIGKSSGSGLMFQGGNTIPVTGSSAADATYDLGASGVRFKDLYLSGGLYVGGVASANHLDDYEEGTFTPTLYGASSAGTTTYATVTGNYTKVGNRCTVNFVCSVTATTGTGSLRLGGLPFSSSGENTTAIMVNNLNWGGGTYLMAYVGDNNTFARVYYLGDDNTWQQQQITNEAQHFIFTLTYQTA